MTKHRDIVFILALTAAALLFGVATIPVFFYLARAVTERREAIFATLFLTLSYHHVWFTQNARGYSAMIFFTVLSTLFLVRWLSKPSNGRRDWFWFSVCGSLGMMALFISGVLIVVLTLLGYAATLPAMIDYFTVGAACARA